MVHAPMASRLLDTKGHFAAELFGDFLLQEQGFLCQAPKSENQFTSVV
jgi:hypothetical protein